MSLYPYYEKHRNEAKWQEGEYEVTRTHMWTGPGCHNGCGVIYYTKDNKVEKIEGDPMNPFNEGRLCMRCLDYTEAANHDDRLKWPLKRVGEKGENKWERISWDQAYDEIVDKVHEIQTEYGPESIVAMEGTGRNVIWQVPYLCYAGFNSPNFTLGFLSGESCSMPRLVTEAVTLGDFTFGDYSQTFMDRFDNGNTEWRLPEVILLWGQNTIVSNPDGFFGHWLVDCMRRGSRLITVDPRLTWMASRSEVWLNLRPGTDAALALTLLHVIINEDLYDHEFVENWTYGFEDLKERVQEWTPEKGSEVTWIDKEDIIAAARLYANADCAASTWGLAIDQSVHGVSSAQAIVAIWTICGNLDKPGGQIIEQYTYGQGLAYDYGFDLLEQSVREKRIGYEMPLKQFGYGMTAHSDSILQCIESGKPYPIKMMWLQSTNPIANMASEAPRIYKAMKSIDYTVVVDIFMTPTAVAFADLVLPCAVSSERWSQRNWWWPLQGIAKVASYAEAKSDEQIILELGKRLNPDKFPWQDDKDWINWIITDQTAPYGGDFDDLNREVVSCPKFEYKKFEKGLLRADGQPGFNTPTGKVELRLTLFDSWGFDPLPYFKEPLESPVSTPTLFKEYPLILMTGRRSWEFFHSEHRQLKTMREFHPDPLVEINPQTALQYGLQDGDWAWIENMRGRCKQKVKVDLAVDPRMVSIEHGWWFPEKEGAEPSLFGVFESNANNLTPMCQNGPTGYGAPMKCQICKIYKVTPENDESIGEIVTRKGGFGYVPK